MRTSGTLLLILVLAGVGVLGLALSRSLEVEGSLPGVEPVDPRPPVPAVDPAPEPTVSHPSGLSWEEPRTTIHADSTVTVQKLARVTASDGSTTLVPVTIRATPVRRPLAER